MCIHVHGGEKLVQDIHPIDVDFWPSNKQCAIYYKTLQHSARTHGDGIVDLRDGPNLGSEGCWKEPSLILIRTLVSHKDSQSDDMVELSRFFPHEDVLDSVAPCCSYQEGWESYEVCSSRIYNYIYPLVN
jgi:hypothetical protein